MRISASFSANCTTRAACRSRSLLWRYSEPCCLSCEEQKPSLPRALPPGPGGHPQTGQLTHPDLARIRCGSRRFLCLTDKVDKVRIPAKANTDSGGNANGIPG